MGREIASLVALVGIAVVVRGDEPARRHRVEIRVTDDQRRQVACRIHLSDDAGEAVVPAGFPNWKDHFCCDGTVKLDLVAGRYHYVVERGPEQESLRGSWQVTASSGHELALSIRRIADLSALNWYSGDLHIHRPMEHVPLLLEANDLDVGPVITWWNQRNAWQRSGPPEATVRRTDGGRIYELMAGEDERGGGAVLYFRLPRPLAIAEAGREHPSSLTYLRLAKQEHPRLWVDIEKPFWRDVPLWLASGLVDSMGIAHNHMWRSGVLGNEAWGRPRDPTAYPGPLGNGLWSLDIYYHALNSGIRLPPTAGSASGVIPNPVGYNRCYVYLDGPLDYDRWWESLRQGRVFVTNAPLLLATINGELPGHRFQSDAASIELQVAGRVISRDPVDRIEVVHNGRIAATISGSAEREWDFSHSLTVDKAGWVLVRAMTSHTESLRFASTGPFEVETPFPDWNAIGTSASFFLEWARERRESLATMLAGAERRDVLALHDEAVEFWEARVRSEPADQP